MNETTRRRMLWIALMGSTGFFLITLVLAASGALTSGWYIMGAAVYGALFIIALIGFVAERAPEPAARPAEAAPAPATVVAPTTVLVRERVLYSTPRGEVLQVQTRNGTEETQYEVVTLGAARPLDEIEIEIDARRWDDRDGDEAPEDEQLKPALTRWGRIHEGI